MQAVEAGSRSSNDLRRQQVRGAQFILSCRLHVDDCEDVPEAARQCLCTNVCAPMLHRTLLIKKDFAPFEAIRKIKEWG